MMNGRPTWQRRPSAGPLLKFVTAQILSRDEKIVELVNLANGRAARLPATRVRFCNVDPAGKGTVLVDMGHYERELA